MDEISVVGIKRLHFFQDEKVVNDAITNFESVYPNENLYIVLSKDGAARLVKEQSNTLFLSYQSSKLKWLLSNCNSFDEIICHSLWYELDKIIVKLKHPNITWIMWGADLYEEVLYRNGYKLYKDEKELFKIRAQYLPVFLYKVLISIRDSIYYKARIKSLKCIHNYCGSNESYKLLCKYVPNNIDLKRKVFIYYPIEQMLDENIYCSYVHGMDIWINNSAAYNGNHIDIFKRIQNIKKATSIHVPLSYGMRKYSKYVEAKGRIILGDNFDPMLTFLPRNEYYSKFLNSNSFIFGHLRGCAMGNIIVALYLGGKVFLFKDNPMYTYFKNLDFILYTIEEDLNETNIYTPLNHDFREHNRKNVMKFYSYDALLKVIKDNF